jgi:hypothetical protein
MKCPICGYPQYCPCESCRDELPSGFKPWIWLEDHYSIKCAGCGFIEGVDWWEYQEYLSMGIQPHDV